MMDNKFRYVYQHEETGRIVVKIYYLEEIEYKDLYLPRYSIIAKNPFTGFHDIEGKKVYENDCQDNWVISYCNGEYACHGMNVGWYVQRDDFVSWSELSSDCKIKINGNIYEGTFNSDWSNQK
jgi:hypothetical protein